MNDIAGGAQPALTHEQWAERDYRPRARDIDAWDREKPERRTTDDSTQYVAKIGIGYDGCVTLMSRAHEWVAVPPPARHALAALALDGQPFGFTHDDLEQLRRAADALSAAAGSTQEKSGDLRPRADALRGLAGRISALLPPRAAGN